MILAQVQVTPSSAGMPGAQLIQQMLNWAQMVALWGSLAALLVGAAMYGLAREGGSYSNASRGKGLAIGGVVGAILAGVAPTAINLLFKAAGS
ncbi:MAG: hypothetical protein QOG43_2936 [Actinomycetota bacterium]|jgi:hypothetical protein|nr:hypothetical protein [Actinomycetota bacterium]